jgi:hypothetical protein
VEEWRSGGVEENKDDCLLETSISVYLFD